MKSIAVLGIGKTGGEVLRRLENQAKYRVVAIDRAHPLTEDLWASVDAAVCFLPGPAFLELFDLLARVPKPMVIGSTGYSLSAEQTARVERLPCPWVMSSNFSLGMSLAKLVITQMAQWCARSQLPIEHHLEETHHVHKKDAPSGTALLWKKWIAEVAPHAAVSVESHRVEDLCGTHQYRIRLPQETMTFEHDATSRAVFAEGAVWALEQILDAGGTTRGRVDFFDLIQHKFQRGTT